jgi:hypothetical protein
MYTARRRTIILTTVVQLLSTTFAPAQGQQSIEVRMRVDQSGLRTVPIPVRERLNVERDNSTDAAALIAAAPPERGAPIFFLIIGIASIPIIWQAGVEMIRQAHFGGLLIDARQSPPLITNSLTIPASMVFFIDPSGQVQRYRSQDFTENLLERLLQGVRR